MERNFGYQFVPAAADPVKSHRVILDDAEIEAAALLEVLQTPGAKVGAWTLLDALLEPVPSRGPFKFKGPIGQAREVKVAVSGLFGRFVARAYLTKYLGLSVFCHLGGAQVALSAKVLARVRRTAAGDLPDWVACTAGLTDLTVAEAKGCHDHKGPAQALARAWTQAQRIDVTVGGLVMPLKRVAVATRWGFQAGGPSDSQLWVRDPVEDGDEIDPERQEQVYLGILRRHLAGLLEPLGHPDLARLLLALAQDEDAGPQAAATLSAIGGQRIEGVDASDLIGGTVTRAGPVGRAAPAPDDVETLRRLDLQPTFVGVERGLIHAAVVGNTAELRVRARLARAREADVVPNAAGTWVVPLIQDRRVIDISGDLT